MRRQSKPSAPLSLSTKLYAATRRARRSGWHRISAACWKWRSDVMHWLQRSQQLCSSAGYVRTLGASYRDIKTVWNLDGDFSFQTRYNIAPSQEVPGIIRNEG